MSKESYNRIHQADEVGGLQDDDDDNVLEQRSGGGSRSGSIDEPHNSTTSTVESKKSDEVQRKKETLTDVKELAAKVTSSVKFAHDVIGDISGPLSR